MGDGWLAGGGKEYSLGCLFYSLNGSDKDQGMREGGFGN